MEANFFLPDKPSVSLKNDYNHFFLPCIFASENVGQGEGWPISPCVQELVNLLVVTLNFLVT